MNLAKEASIIEKMLPLDTESPLINQEDMAQGLEGLLFDATKSYAFLCALSTISPSMYSKSIISHSFYDGNVSILIHSLYKLMDGQKGNNVCHTWVKKKLYKRIENLSKKEGEYIHSSLQDPNRCPHLKYIKEKRNKSFAHNEYYTSKLDSSEIEKCLHFFVRTIHLLNKLLKTQNPELGPAPHPLLSFEIASYGLEKFFSKDDIKTMKENWNTLRRKISNWQETPLKLTKT